MASKREPVTSHGLRERTRDELIEAQQRAARDGAPWGEVLGRPLAHAIRYALNVALARDVAWVESCRDENGERLLSELRGRVDELAPHDWLALRHTKEHVWRVLVDAKRRSNGPPARNLSDARLSEAEARAYMARFGLGPVVHP